MFLCKRLFFEVGVMQESALQQKKAPCFSHGAKKPFSLK